MYKRLLRIFSILLSMALLVTMTSCKNSKKAGGKTNKKPDKVTASTDNGDNTESGVESLTEDLGDDYFGCDYIGELGVL